jgi:hypothetical protein
LQLACNLVKLKEERGEARKEGGWMEKQKEKVRKPE